LQSLFNIAPDIRYFAYIQKHIPV